MDKKLNSAIASMAYLHRLCDFQGAQPHSRRLCRSDDAGQEALSAEGGSVGTDGGPYRLGRAQIGDYNEVLHSLRQVRARLETYRNKKGHK